MALPIARTWHFFFTSPVLALILPVPTTVLAFFGSMLCSLCHIFCSMKHPGEIFWRIFSRVLILMEHTQMPECSDYIFKMSSSGRYQFVFYSAFVSQTLPSVELQKFLHVTLSCAVVCPENSICFSILEVPAVSLQFSVSTGLCMNFPLLHHGLKTLSRQ